MYEVLLATLEKQMRSGDVLAVIREYFYSPWTEKPGPPITIDGHTWHDLTPLKLLERDLLLRVVAPRNATLIVLSDWAHREASDLATIESNIASVRDVMQRHSRAARAHVMPLHPCLCNLGTTPSDETLLAGPSLCPRTVPGTEIDAFVDDHHLTTAGSIYLWPHLCDAMEGIGLL